MGYFFLSVTVIIMVSIYSEEYQRFLSRLKAARREARITQVEVAARLGRPQSYVSKCESGERRVDAIELYRFAKLYKKPVSFFVGETSTSRKAGKKKKK